MRGPSHRVSSRAVAVSALPLRIYALIDKEVLCWSDMSHDPSFFVAILYGKQIKQEPDQKAKSHRTPFPLQNLPWLMAKFLVNESPPQLNHDIARSSLLQTLCPLLLFPELHPPRHLAQKVGCCFVFSLHTLLSWRCYTTTAVIYL